MSFTDRAVIQVSKPLHDRLTELKQQQQAQLKRQVSFSEVIEQLLEIRDGWLAEARGRS